MTNRFAVFFGLFILMFGALDYLLFGTEHLLFLAKKMMDMMEWLSFWR